MKYLKELRAYLQKVIVETSSGNEDSFPGSYMSGQIPLEVLTSELKAADITTLLLVGDEVKLNQRIFEALRSDVELEYLSDSELKEKLWHLTCEVFVDSVRYKNASALNLKAQAFLSDLFKPLEEHEVMFKVNHFDSGEKPIEFGQALITKLSKQELLDWGFSSSNHHLRNETNFANKTVIIIKELGNNRQNVTLRARKKALHDLKSLQVFLSKHSLIPEEQILFSLAEDVAHRKTGQPQTLLTKWERSREPWGLEHGGSIESLIEEGHKLLQTKDEFNDKTRGLIDRALFWVGKSIDEPDYDLKIVILCTALETLLTTVADKRKGEAIAYRKVILDALLDGEVKHPGGLLWIYERRSKVVHGASIEISTRREYKTLLWHTQAALSNFVNLVSQKGFTKQSQVIEMIESSAYVNDLLNWLAAFTDKQSISIREALTKVAGDSPSFEKVMTASKKLSPDERRRLAESLLADTQQ